MLLGLKGKVEHGDNGLYGARYFLLCGVKGDEDGGGVKRMFVALEHPMIGECPLCCMCMNGV